MSDNQIENSSNSSSYTKELDNNQLEILIKAWREAFDAIKQSVALIDLNKCVIRCNKAMSIFLQMNFNDILSRNICELLSEKTDINFCVLSEIIPNNEESYYEFTYKDNHYEIILNSFTDNENNIIGHVFILADITERKNIEKKLIKNQSQLRSLSIQLSSAEQNERRELSLILHESIGQSLSLIKLKLDILSKITKNSTSSILINEIRELVSSSINTTRSLCFELSPPILTDIGLSAAIDWLIELFSTRYDMKIKTKYDDLHITLPNELSDFIYHTLNELLMNIVKHAKTRNVQIDIKIQNNTIILNIIDDGIGFDTGIIENAGVEMNHFGLYSLRERLIALEGNIQINSEYNKGTNIVINIPIS